MAVSGGTWLSAGRNAGRATGLGDLVFQRLNSLILSLSRSSSPL